LRNQNPDSKNKNSIESLENKGQLPNKIEQKDWEEKKERREN
jgi:hypothetical protein